LQIQDAPNAIDASKTTGAVTFQNLTFSYREQNGDTQEVPAVQDIELQLDPGKFYAFVGPSGAGKSTLYSLLLRFYDPDEGSILLDGHDIRTLSQVSLRANIGVVSQDTFLFHDTVMENIRFARPDADDEEVFRAAEAAGRVEYAAPVPMHQPRRRRNQPVRRVAGPAHPRHGAFGPRTLAAAAAGAAQHGVPRHHLGRGAVAEPAAGAWRQAAAARRARPRRARR
jgi:hypothetical protein